MNKPEAFSTMAVFGLIWLAALYISTPGNSPPLYLWNCATTSTTVLIDGLTHIGTFCGSTFPGSLLYSAFAYLLTAFSALGLILKKAIRKVPSLPPSS
jgi:hypothetical protein